MDELPPNPLREGLNGARRPGPLTLVLFGASGDLAHRKIAPALYNLALDRLLPDGLSVVGVARRPWSDDEFRRAMADGVASFSRRRPPEPSIWSALAEDMRYVPGDFASPDTYRALGQALAGLPAGGSRLYYLATPPDFYDDIVRGIGTIQRGDG